MVNSPLRTRSLIMEAVRSASHRPDWLRASLLSGFVATFAMTASIAVGYGIARGIGHQDGNTLERWLYGLTQNRMTNDFSDRFLLVMLGNLVFGLGLAMTYARLVGPLMKQVGWRSGMLFSIVPWLLSICVFFPIAGAGFLGNDLGAGPLPVIGNLVIHLVFGAVLGAMYSIDMETGLDDTQIDRYAAATAERGAAIGLAVGGVIGAAGGWLMAGEFDRLASQPVIALAGALSGAAVGAMLGSFAGMADESSAPRTSVAKLAPRKVTNET